MSDETKTPCAFTPLQGGAAAASALLDTGRCSLADVKEALWLAVECDAVDVVYAMVTHSSPPPPAILNEFRELNCEFGHGGGGGGGRGGGGGGGSLKTGLAHVAARKGCVPMVTVVIYGCGCWWARL